MESVIARIFKKDNKTVVIIEDVTVTNHIQNFI
jgi:hypothetical protein